MKTLIRPNKLVKGDTVATVSLSWGGAGDADLLWRYNVGKERLEKLFGLNVIEMPNTLKGSEFIYNNPEKRAKDLMEAFANPDVKAIFSCIGGDDSIRMLPYIDFEVMGQNPKIFMGYSDTTITHLMCTKAGISSFYGPSILAEIAENVKIFDYTVESLENVLFHSEPIGDIQAAKSWNGERLEWTEANRDIEKQLSPNEGYQLLQGGGKVQGRLFGGCIEVLEMAKGTTLWPDDAFFDDVILFFETSEEMPDPSYIKYWLRNYGAQGILHRVKGLIFGKPYQEKHFDAYKEMILCVLAEYDLPELPVLYNATFGHNQPMCVLPYGAMAEIDCDNKAFSILESGVI